MHEVCQGSTPAVSYSAGASRGSLKEEQRWARGSRSWARAPSAATSAATCLGPARDVTLIDPWPDHIDTIKRDGLQAGRHPGRVPGTPEGAAPPRGPEPVQEPGRHRVRLHEVVRHGLGHHDDQPVPGAGRLHRLAPEQHQRGADRRASSAGGGWSAASPAASASTPTRRATSRGRSSRAGRATRCSGSARSTGGSPRASRRSPRC